ncbi:MAG: DUF3108 domain-containing protein [Deltaproteobacteria bacterium]|nr:DUF3108 domain-containing protein [Deltaproteobacteria bacterium]
MKSKGNISGAVFFLICTLAALSVFADPFKVGERLEYRLSWGGIPAGRSVLEVVDMVDVKGARAYHLLSRVSSNDAIATFYSLNDRIDTYVATDDLRTLKYVALTKENSRVRDEIAFFDYKKGEIKYKKRGKEKIISIPPDLYDSISSFYYLRRLPLKAGEKVFINTFSGGRIYENTIQVMGREKVSVRWGTFETLKVFIRAVERGKGKKKGESYLWLTDDERKLPVKIKTKSNFGYIVSELERAVTSREK